ncbi:MAG: ParA family protein [Defluviitaleaceae bacterium]|nr:ParA family protein [Defluviitaleaceae bacterium]
MKTISIINLKGGVAKTITAANMAHILATVHGKRVLLADNDKQGNISKMFGLHSYDDFSIADVLTNRAAFLEEVISPTRYPNLDVLPANMNLLAAIREVLIDSTRPQQTRLRSAFKTLEDAGEYDFCIIDNAPDINISTINALVASHEVIIPIKIDKFAFDGLAELVEQINITREELNPGLTVRGCLVTSYQRNEVNKQGEAALRENYPVFNTHIRRTEKVDESTFAAAPIIDYSPRCGAARDYLAFVSEYVSESDTKGGADNA